LVKVNDDGFRVTAGDVTVTPVPDTGTDSGLSPALSVIVTLAERAPDAVGVKVTVIVQFAPAASDAGQVFVCEKSVEFVPVAAIELIVSAAFPVLVSVTPWDALVVPTVWLENVNEAGLRLTAGAVATPVPDS
jgi:hypothetical protein